MAVVLETTLGDITIDLYMKERPRACLNFLKLCKMKYYNFNLFHTVNQGFIAQTGDPTGSRIGGESIWGVMQGPLKRYFEAEDTPRIKHTSIGLVSFVGDKNNMLGSQFFITLATELTYLDAKHCVFGEVVEGLEVLRALNDAICDNDHRPYQDIRITHTVILEDPFPDPEELKIPDRSPEPTAERLQGGRIAPDEEIDETVGKSAHEVAEIVAAQEAKARATILEMIGDIPDAEMAPPENVLFVCKLNPVTNDDDLEIIFSRFGKIKSCEVIRDKKTDDSLQYAFVEFEDQKSCEDAYFKMDNVLIDDRRIHVDFSQSVAKVKWLGKGRGVTHYNDKGEKQKGDPKNDIGNGRYNENKHKTNLDSSSKQSDKNKDRKYESSSSRDKYRNDDSRNKYSTSEYRSERYYKDRYDKSRPKDYGSYNRYQENYTQQRKSYYRDDPIRNKYDKQMRGSRSRDKAYYRNEKPRYRGAPAEETNKRREVEAYKHKKHKYEQDFDVNRYKNKSDNNKKDTSGDETNSEVEQEKKLRKSKKKNTKKRKQESSSDSESESDSESDHKSSKKKKQKHRRSSSSENESDEKRKRRSKK